MFDGALQPIYANRLAFLLSVKHILEMSKAVKSFALPHDSNVHKQNQLWELYTVLKNEPEYPNKRRHKGCLSVY